MDHKFQNVWALKMPWVEPIFSEARMVTSVKCCVCSKIEKNTRFWCKVGFHWESCMERESSSW